MHHEKAEALAELVRQRRGEIVVCWRDRKDAFCELAEPPLEIGNDVAGSPPDHWNGDALSSHGANDEQAVVEIGERKGGLRASGPQLVNERRCVIDAEWIRLTHYNFDVSVLGRSAQAPGLGDTVGGVLIHNCDVLDFAPRRSRNCDCVIDLRTANYRGLGSHLEDALQPPAGNLVSECLSDKGD